MPNQSCSPLHSACFWLFTLACCLLPVASLWANPEPVITNVVAVPRADNSGIVDITYTLSDALPEGLHIFVDVSAHGGATWTINPSPASLSGAVGSGIGSGTHTIVWSSKKDLPGALGDQFQIRVTDGGSLDWVYINDPGVSGREGFNGYMSKYETTNAQYCQFLNAARASGDITVSGNDVKGASGSNSGTDFAGQYYYYLAGSGWTYNGATSGGAARINWTGSAFTVDSSFENHPVTYVSWYGATAFASYYGWRLPTEWEWQAVADFDGSYIYGCGITISNSKANYSNSVHPYGTTAVGAFGVYGHGLADLAGNVWEWTSSLYSTTSSYRVVPGGSWTNYDDNCTVSSWGYDFPDSRDLSIGFRVCR